MNTLQRTCPECGKSMSVKSWDLTDMKLWGSFRLARALGIVLVGRRPDPSGEVYKASGRWGKAGSPKMVPMFDTVPEEADNKEAELQLNHYRIMLEELGIDIYRMQLQVTVRDGGLYIAKNRGVFRNIYRIPIKRLDDTEVKDYFTFKGAALAQALSEGKWDVPCNSEESWDGVRCRSFCDVWNQCPEGRRVRNTPEGEEQ